LSEPIPPRKLPRQLQRFIDDHGWRRFRAQHLIHGNAQNVAVHGRHPLDLPMLRVLRDALVDQGDIRRDAADLMKPVEALSSRERRA
jgi:hypothetical protein